MKKQLTVAGISVLLLTGVAFTSFAQQKDKKNNKKEHQQSEGKHNDKQDKSGNRDVAKNKNNGNPPHKMDQKEKQAKHEMKTNKGKNNDNKDRKEVREEMKQVNNGKKFTKSNYNWNHETFKNRKQLKNQDKVTICHKFKSNNEPGVNLRVSSNAVKAHMNHGDFLGGCPAVTSSGLSTIFLKKRTEYYNDLQISQEKLLYSQSILNYATIRLANSRLQLVTLQSNNMPVADIERKQTTVIELEQNVSLLETLIGATATYVASKLQ